MELLDQILTRDEGGGLNLAAVPARPGVYLLADDAGQPIVLAFGENMRRNIRYRLTEPPPGKKSKRAKLGEVVTQLRWRRTYSAFETTVVHWLTARRLFPRNYRKQLAFGPAWMLRVDPAERTPRFRAVREAADDAARYIGPIPTQADAEAWAATLEDAFDLCRYHHVLELAPHGERCAYFDMGKCPAPCDGTISLETYRGTIGEALAFCLGEQGPRLAALERAMHEAAGRQEFEKAAAIRETRQRAAAIVEKPAYRHMMDLTHWGWLVLQRGAPLEMAGQPTRNTVQPSIVRGGRLSVPIAAAVDRLAEALPGWLDGTAPSIAELAVDANDVQGRSEIIWLTAKFLFREDGGEGLFFRLDRLPAPQEILAAMQERFETTPMVGVEGEAAGD